MDALQRLDMLQLGGERDHILVVSERADVLSEIGGEIVDRFRCLLRILSDQRFDDGESVIHKVRRYLLLHQPDL